MLFTNREYIGLNIPFKITRNMNESEKKNIYEMTLAEGRRVLKV